MRPEEYVEVLEQRGEELVPEEAGEVAVARRPRAIVSSTAAPSGRSYRTRAVLRYSATWAVLVIAILLTLVLLQFGFD